MTDSSLHCPHCQARYRIDPARLQLLPGKVRCARCGEIFDRFEEDVCSTSVERSRDASSVNDSGRLLVVDDSKYFRNLLTEILRPLFADVLQAENGEEALPLLVKEKPDLLILDLNLPGMNGIELLRLVRANPLLSSLKILVISSQAVQFNQALSACAPDAIMSKSFKPEQLVVNVQRLLRNGK